jgi:hypothetical protein
MTKALILWLLTTAGMYPKEITVEFSSIQQMAWTVKITDKAEVARIVNSLEVSTSDIGFFPASQRNCVVRFGTTGRCWITTPIDMVTPLGLVMVKDNFFREVNRTVNKHLGRKVSLLWP